MALSSLILLGLTLGVALARPQIAVQPAPACSTPACKAAAAYIMDAMNATASPCDNFYAFACGGWQSHHTIPDWKARTGTFDSLNDQMTGQIRSLLDKFNLVTDSKTAPGAVSYGAYLHQSCVALGNQTNDVGLTQLKAVVKAVFGDREWPIGRLPDPKDDHTWNVNFVRAFVSGISSVFEVSSYPDPKNVTVNSIVLNSASLGLGDKELQNLTASAKDVAAYKAYISQSAKLFCGANCDADSLTKDIDDIVHLESQLALNKLSPEDMRNPEKTYNKLSFKQLAEATHFDFFKSLLLPILKTLGVTPPASLDPASTTLIVSDVNYTIAAIRILSKTPARTLANYIGWRTVAAFGPVSSEAFRQNAFAFKQVTTGVKKIEERAEACSNLANNNVNMALSRLFVEKHFTDKEKKAATEIIDTIQESYRGLIEKNDWLDAKTKTASLSKLAHVHKNVAYPSWLLKSEELDEFYNLSNKTLVQKLLAEKNYLLTLVEFNALQLIRQVEYFEKPIDINKAWPMPPAIINAAYEPTQNSITIPAGILKSPFFDSERPFSLNYGFIGVVIGHELTHGLDDEGRQYDERGNLHTWWTPESIQRFSDRSKCFVNEYGSQVEPITHLHLNGQNTLGENIADNGGVHESFNAFMARQAKSGPSPTLADLPKYTSEQLYFISFANTWCSLTRPEKLKQQIEYDPHSPSQYRVNVPLSNSADFAKAFNCPAGSPMNPKKKCLLW